MIWTNVVSKYASIFEESRIKRSPAVKKKIKMYPLEQQVPVLPDIKLDHLVRMTDSIGIFQHATFNVPNFSEGYCTDDNARALILAGKYEAGIAAMKSLGYDDHPDVAGSIGFANGKLGRLTEARAWYDKALAADSGHLVTWGYSGALHVVQGELDKARADLARIKAICGGTACREYRELEGLIASKDR